MCSNLAQRSATAKGLHVVALAPRPLPFGTGRRTLGSSSMACNAFANVDVKEASHLVQGGQHTYVDVRTVEEFAAGHCPSAVNVPVMVKQGGGMAPNPQFLEQVRAHIHACTVCEAAAAMQWRHPAPLAACGLALR